MVKLIIVGRRRPGITRAQALEHLRGVHGAMVVRPPPDAGPMPSDYTQNHVIDAAYALGANAAHSLERDLVTELWFDSPQALAAANATPYYKTRLQPDEPNFVDQTTVAAGLHNATPRRNPQAGRFKLFAFLNPAATAEPAAFDATVARLADHIAAEPQVQDVVVNTPLPRPDGAAPFARAVLEAWFAEAAEAAAFARARWTALLSGGVEGVLDPCACLYILAEAFDTARLRSETAAE